MENTASLFAQNKQDMLPAIAPEGQTNLGLMSSFNGAVQQLSVQPSLPDNDNRLADNDNTLNKQQVVMSAENAGNSLRETFPPKQQGDVAYGMTSIGNACKELGASIFGLLGAKPEEPKIEPDNENVFRPMGMNMGMNLTPGMR